MTTREPEWTEQDHAEILALHMWRTGFCPCGCGHRYTDTTSPEETGPRFAAVRTVCRARLALLEAQEAASGPNARHTAARLWTVEKMG